MASKVAGFGAAEPRWDLPFGWWGFGGQPKVLGAAGRGPAAGKGGIWVRHSGGTDSMVGRQVGRSGRVLGIFAKREPA